MTDTRPKTRVITDPAEVEQQRIKHIGKMNFEQHPPFYEPPKLSFMGQMRNSIAPRCQIAVIGGQGWLEALHDKTH